MSMETEELTGTELRYFGKMMAAISHEIKNSLAIINENAGLMEDLSLMAKSGHQLDPQRVEALSGRVIKQVQRADTTVKKMNRLAHSVDDPVKEIDVAELLDFTMELGKKSAASLGVELRVTPPPSPVRINSNPFLLMNLLWEVMCYACTRVDGTPAISIAVARNAKGVELAFTPVNDAGQDGFSLDEAPFSGLVSCLNAEILNLADSRALVLTLPETV
ncbi:MAG: HAMP domain-containing histidine kinase [Desulfobacteraceae bacterium]|nr:HAMP domain-containing histidine kinase [Desulfobacteraceae bacterium]